MPDSGAPICIRPICPGQYGSDRSGWFSSRGWSASPPAFGANCSFGVWDGLFLGALLSNLGRAGSGEFFHNNQNDPGYQRWRQEANQQAQGNPDLRAKLDELDRQLSESDGEPRTPGALPPDIPPEVAKVPPSRTSGVPGDGSGWVWAVLLAGRGGIAFLACQRRPSANGPSGGSAVRLPANALQNAGNLLRHKLSGEGNGRGPVRQVQGAKPGHAVCRADRQPRSGTRHRVHHGRGGAGRRQGLG